MKSINGLLALFFILLPGLVIADKPKVVTTTNIVHDLVMQLGGDKIETEALMGAGIDPHYYKATFSDMRKLAHADLVFYSGLELEGRMQSVLENLSSLKPVVPLSSFINPSLLIYEQKTPDPHFWFNLRLWVIAAEGVAQTLATHWPEHQDYFFQQLNDYKQELDNTHQWVTEQIASIPRAQRILITAHDAFSYYGSAYDIDVMGLQGINTTSEFGLSDLRLLKDVIKSRGVKAVFIESSVPKRSIESLMAGVKAEGGEVKLGGELLSDALGRKGSETADFIGMIRYNTRTIVKALK